MRIQSTRRWLAAALSLGIRGARGSDEPQVNKTAVTFVDADFQAFGNRDGVPVFVLADEGRMPQPEQTFSKTFSWQINKEGLQVEEIDIWFLRGDVPWKIANATVDNFKDSIGGPPETEQTTLFKTPTTTIEPRPSHNIRRMNRRNIDLNPNIKVEASATEGRGVMTILDVRKLQVYNSQTMYLGAVWSGNGRNGETYSRAFTVVNTQAEFEVLDPIAFRNMSAVQPELNHTVATSLGNPPDETPTTSARPSTDESQRSPDGGLATGAIIGIAVACGVFGLLLIGAGIWFLIHRRRKQATTSHIGSSGRPYGVDRSRTEDLIAEKEASAGGADPSPHSPYSDDGVVLVPTGASSGRPYHHEGSPVVPVGAGVGGAAAAPVLSHHPQARSYTPYSDHGSLGGGGVVASGSPSTHASSIVHSTHEDTPRAGMGSPTAGRATPHSSLSPRYAHLVEEGMTEDEIRRLEDEERQLDAAIEQARAR